MDSDIDALGLDQNPSGVILIPPIAEQNGKPIMVKVARVLLMKFDPFSTVWKAAFILGVGGPGLVSAGRAAPARNGCTTRMRLNAPKIDTDEN